MTYGRALDAANGRNLDVAAVSRLAELVSGYFSPRAVKAPSSGPSGHLLRKGRRDGAARSGVPQRRPRAGCHSSKPDPLIRVVLQLAIGAGMLAGAWTGACRAETLEERLQLCGSCHGEGGNSKMENVPSLAGQPALFLTNQLILMRERVRKSEPMEPFVKGLKDDEIVVIAEHFTKMQPEPSNETVDQSAVARGADLAEQLRCGSCHLPTYQGQEQIPRLAPQRLDYLVRSLTEYRDGSRSGIDTSMNGVMYRVSDQDIRALAHYLGSRR
jgi:cytochrome c553